MQMRAHSLCICGHVVLRVLRICCVACLALTCARLRPKKWHLTGAAALLCGSGLEVAWGNYDDQIGRRCFAFNVKSQWDPRASRWVERHCYSIVATTWHHYTANAVEALNTVWS
jgi:hypothetical protein